MKRPYFTPIVTVLTVEVAEAVLLQSMPYQRPIDGDSVIPPPDDDDEDGNDDDVWGL